MAIHPSNYSPVTVRSTVAHQPGQKNGEKISSGRDYSVEFDDALLSQGGWMNPRLDGCEITGLYQNKFSKINTPRQYGGIKSPNIEHLINITESWGGDKGNFGRNPAVQTYTNTIFFGATLSGYQEDSRFPNVGEDFSYIFINKAYTFDPQNDEFFITELLGKDDKVFERVLKQDLSYASTFNFRLLDEGTEHDLQQEYTVHWNAGLFSLLGTFDSCSEAPYTPELQVTTQYVASNTIKDYYGVPYNGWITDNYTQNQVPSFLNKNNRTIMTGSFQVESNIDTWWWRRPRTSSYFAKGGLLSSHNSASGKTFFGNGTRGLHTSGDMSTSVWGFFYRLIGTAVGGGNTDFVFQDKKEQKFYGKAPAKNDLHIMTFNDAKGCVKDIQTELRYQRNTTQALRHFGSISISPGRKIPIPGVSLSKPELGSSGFSINSKIASLSFNEYSVQSSFTAGSGGVGYQYYTWFVGGNASGSEAVGYIPPGTITGSGNFPGTPTLERYTISKLIKRPNVIMADINKINQLFDGIGGKGFLCIPDNINPQIKNNLDYYLKKAELIDKGPNRKNLSSRSPRILRNKLKLKSNHLNPGKKEI
tara:strand:+ start:746 stop:2512 length:1767 start_codon:yes stop_codon:yes gene_type:complete